MEDRYFDHSQLQHLALTRNVKFNILEPPGLGHTIHFYTDFVVINVIKLINFRPTRKKLIVMSGLTFNS